MGFETCIEIVLANSHRIKRRVERCPELDGSLSCCINLVAGLNAEYSPTNTNGYSPLYMTFIRRISPVGAESSMIAPKKLSYDMEAWGGRRACGHDQHGR